MRGGGDKAPLPPGLCLDCPGLLPRLPDAAIALLSDNVAPGFESLLARAQRQASATLHEQLRRTRENATGAAVAHAAGLDVGQDVWFRAAPLQLLPDRDTLVIAGPASLDLDQEESRALIDALNRYLSPDAYRFFLTDSCDWLLRVIADAPALQLPDLGEVEGRRLADCLPEGGGGSHWVRWLNEMQMVLHGSDVSEARAARGRARVNGLWIWHGGRLPANPRLPWDRVFTADLGLRGLAALADVPCAPSTSVAAAVEAASTGGRVLVSLPAAPVVNDGAGFSAWEDWLRAVDERWGQPLSRALQTGSLSAVRLCVGDQREWACRPGDRRRIWRRRRRLRDHLLEGR